MKAEGAAERAVDTPHDELHGPSIQPTNAVHPSDALHPSVDGDDVAPRSGPTARTLPRHHTLDGERLVGRILRMGAIGSGTLFAASLIVGAFEPDQTSAVAADILRKAAGSILLVTPIVRLIVGGSILAVKGEWRYALYAGAILFLLAIALGTGVHV